MDGVRFADDLTDLGDGSTLTGLNVDESGGYVAMLNGLDSTVWTGEHRGVDTSTHATCANWTSDLAMDNGVAGINYVSNDSWFHFVPRPCDGLRRLYCFED